MRAIFFTFILSVFTSLIAYAQEEKGDKIESLKIAFITNRLDLSPKEAQIFWPVYNQYNEKLEALRKEHRQKFIGVKDKMETMSDKEAEALIDEEMVFRQREVDIQKEYHVELKKVLPVKKVAKLYMAEEAFKRQLLKKLQQKRN